MQEGDKLDGTSPGEPPRHQHTIARSVFLIGIPELKAPELVGRHLLLPGSSDYLSLPQRTRAFCQWAISRDDWDYLFKCDDDTYVSISRLIRYPLTADYIGAEWRPGVRYASGGAGYFLSRKAAEVVAEHLTRKEGPEDVYVRDALASQGIPFTQDQRFVALGNEELRPRADNDLITLHCVPSVPADLFYKSHQECTGAAFSSEDAASSLERMPERFSADAPLRYDLGGYKSAANGRITVNLFGDSDLHHDIRELDAFISEDAVVDEFYLSHTLEHIPVVDYHKFLRDLYRKLRNFGRVIVIQTDAEAVLRAWHSGQLSFRAMRATLFPQAAQIRKNAFSMHHNMWTEEELAEDFRAVGFVAETFDAGTWPYDQLDELLPEETRPCFGFPIRNLGVIATKMKWSGGDLSTLDSADMPTHLDPNPPLSKRLSPEDLRCLKEGQHQLTRMLRYLFEEVCEPHGIRALAWGGTLIGAVNYGGWVPWDADADILVHRDDLERFKALVRASCPADFWYQSRETDPHYTPTIEKLRYLHAHYAGSERYGWHGGLQVDINQFWIEDGVFVTSAPDNDPTLGKRLREEDILPAIELLFDGVRLRTFRDPAAYLRVRYATEPLQSERNVSVEARYPHEGAVRLGASAADRARYPRLYKDQS